MKKYFAFLLSLFIILSCNKANFINKTISIFYNDKKYNIIFNSNGTISGDKKIFCIIEGYITMPCDNYPYNTFDKWVNLEEGKSIIIYNDERTLQGNVKHIYFFKKKLLVLETRVKECCNKKILDYKSNFSNELHEIDLKDFYTKEQVEYFKMKPYIRFISSDNGLKLRQSPNLESAVIDLMNKGDKFFIIKRNDEETKIDGISGFEAPPILWTIN